MEDQLRALGLAINVVVLWNTRSIQAALEGIGRQRIQVRAEDAARRSPLLHEHINLLGRSEFNLPDEMTRGQLWPLRVWKHWTTSWPSCLSAVFRSNSCGPPSSCSDEVQCESRSQFRGLTLLFLFRLGQA